MTWSNFFFFGREKIFIFEEARGANLEKPSLFLLLEFSALYTMAGITVKDVNSHGTISFPNQKPEQEGKIREKIGREKKRKKKAFFFCYCKGKNYPLEKKYGLLSLHAFSLHFLYFIFFGYASFDSTNAFKKRLNN